MKKKELIEKLTDVPDDSEIVIEIPFDINGKVTEISRNIERIDVWENGKKVVFSSNWHIKLRF